MGNSGFGKAEKDPTKGQPGSLNSTAGKSSLGHSGTGPYGAVMAQRNPMFVPVYVGEFP